jgi:glycine/D-amino acid oxidase-like deaminating enzyme
LITASIKNLKIKAPSHLDKGDCYFRNVDDRILLVGGRNLDFNSETTIVFGQTEIVKNKLEELLKELILPHHGFQIACRWSGIIGIGIRKKPIVSKLSENVYCEVRLGGMGIAIGNLVGKKLADLI